MAGVRYDLDGSSDGLVSSLEEAIRALTTTIAKTKDLEDQQKKTEGSTQRLIGVLRAGAGGMVALASATIGAGTALAGMAGDAAAAIGEMEGFANRTGLAVETINGLRLAAAAAGKELEDVVPEDLAVRIFEAAQGAGDGAEAFEILGVKARAANGTLRNADETFRDIIDRLAQLEDRTLAASLADQLFSDQGTALIGVLRDGSAELDGFVSLASEYGYRVGPEAAKVTSDWNQGVAALKLSLEDGVQSILDWAGAIGLSGKNLTFAAAILVHWSSLLREGSALITDTEEALARADARALEFWQSFSRGAEEGTRAGDKFHGTIVRVKDEKLEKDLEKIAREADKAAREMWALEQRSEDFWTSWARDQRSAELDKAFLPLTAALGLAQVEAEKMIEALNGMADGVGEAFDKAVERHRSLMGGLGAIRDQVADGIGLVFETLSESAQAELDKIENRVDRQREKVDDLRERAEQGDQQAREQLEAEKAALRELEQERRASARRAFEAEQSTRREEAVMGIALALIQAYAQLGPIGGALATPGMLGLLGMQLERINSAQPPRHSGGPVDSMGADEGLLLGHLMRQGEQLRVISQRGAEMFEALERGQGRRRGDAPARLVLADAGRAIGEALVREAARPGSRLGSAGSVGAGDPYRRT